MTLLDVVAVLDPRLVGRAGCLGGFAGLRLVGRAGRLGGFAALRLVRRARLVRSILVTLLDVAGVPVRVGTGRRELVAGGGAGAGAVVAALATPAPMPPMASKPIAPASIVFLRVMSVPSVQNTPGWLL